MPPAGMVLASLTALSLTSRSIQMRWDLQLAWFIEWSRMDIMAKELILIVLSCAMWRPILSGYGVEFKCHNQSVVDSISKGSSKEPVTMHLLQCLWFFSVYFDIRVMVTPYKHLMQSYKTHFCVYNYVIVFSCNTSKSLVIPHKCSIANYLMLLVVYI